MIRKLTTRKFGFNSRKHRILCVSVKLAVLFWESSSEHATAQLTTSNHFFFN